MSKQAFDDAAEEFLHDPLQQSHDRLEEPLHARYQIQSSLGKKAGRRTWLAQDLQTQELTVVKLLTFNHEFAWDDLKLFEREAQTLQALSHPAIPSYRDYFEFDAAYGKGFALVQTYLPARSLEQHLKAGRSFSEADVKQLAKDLLNILIYLHERQPSVIHRDIKPSNILLTDRTGNSPGQIYLVDFGSVQTLAAKEGSTITVVGTYGYMPPEQFGGRATPASDLYSLGATLICLVTGQHPADLPQTDLRIEFEQAAKLSPGFTHWLQWLTEPSLSKRPASAAEALEELEWGSRSPVNTTTFNHLTVKPPKSKIMVNGERTFLEILLPSRQISLRKPWSWALIALVIFFPYILVPWGLFAFVMWLLSGLLGQTQLRIDQQQISITRKMFRWRYGSTSSIPRRHIWKLEVVYSNRSSLGLWIGTQRYLIRGTAAEIAWLAAELSAWLDLPIS